MSAVTSLLPVAWDLDAIQGRLKRECQPFILQVAVVIARLSVLMSSPFCGNSWLLLGFYEYDDQSPGRLFKENGCSYRTKLPIPAVSYARSPSWSGLISNYQHVASR